MDHDHSKEEELVTFLDAVIYFSVVLTVSRVGLSALLGHGMSVWASTEVKKSFGHACVWLLSSRIIHHRDEFSCLRVCNAPFNFY
jgi:hypothetical protein